MPTSNTAYDMLTRGVPGTNGAQCKVFHSYFPLGKSQTRTHLLLIALLATRRLVQQLFPPLNWKLWESRGLASHVSHCVPASLEHAALGA